MTIIKCRYSNKTKYLIAYTALFFCLSLVVFFPFYFMGVSLVNVNDGLLQFIPARLYQHEYIRNFFQSLLHGKLSLPLFDFTIGFGENPIEILNFYGFNNPLVILSSLFPIRYVGLIYSIYYILTLYISGLAFSWYCFYKKKKWLYILIGACFYAFSGYAVNMGLKWADYMVYLMIFPLVLLGIEKLVFENKGKLFIFSIVYSALCSFYFLYGLTLFGVIYVVILLTSTSSASVSMGCKRKVLAKGAGCYLLALGISSPILLPSVFGFLQSARTESPGTFSLLFYNLGYYRDLFLQLLSPYSAGPWAMIPYSILLAVGYIAYAWKKDKVWCRFSVIIILFFVVSPLGSFVFNGFSYPTDRWWFAFAFLISYLAVNGCEALKENARPAIRSMLIVSMLYAVLIYTKQDIEREYYIGFSLLLLSVIIIIFMQNYDFSGKLKTAHCKNNFVGYLCITVFSLVIICGYTYPAEKGGVITWIENKESAFEKMGAFPTQDLALLYDNKDVWNGRVTARPQRIIYNRGMALGYPGTTEYFSIINGSLSEFGRRLELADEHWSYAIEGLDNRTDINALASVRYLAIEPQSKQSLPKGYKKISESDKAVLYENQYFLPLAVGYTSYFTDKNQNPIELQADMMRSVLLETDSTTVPEIQMPDSSKNVVSEIPFTIIGADGVDLQNNTITVSKENAQVQFQYDAPADSELYVRFANLNLKERYDGEISIYTESTKNTSNIYVLGNGNAHYIKRDGYTQNLGYYASGQKDTCTIHFSKPTQITFDSIKIYAQSLRDYDENVNLLKKNALQNIKLNNNSVSGNLDLDENCLLTFSIPYSIGWKAYIDGQPAKIMKANVMNMAVEVPKGPHEIKLCYESPGLRLGIALLIISGAVILLLEILKKRKRRKGANENSC